jgi:hypothetical protein
MGIRFSCHHCGHPLNIKQDLAGKVGRCPTCQGQFRIPLCDAATSSSINGTGLQSASVEPIQPIARAATSQAPSGTTPRAVGHAAAKTVSTKPAPSPLAKTLSIKTPNTKNSVPQNSVPQTPVPQSTPRNPASQRTTQPTAKAAPANRQPAPDATPTAEPHWHVRPPSGGEYGPASDELIRTWISEYRITPSSQLKRADWKEWRVASEVFPDLLPKSNHTSTPATPSAQPAAIVASSPAPKPNSTTPSIDQAAAQGPPDLIVNEPLIGDAKIGKKRMAKLRRRTTLVIALGIFTLLLIGVLLFLTLRPTA